MYEIIIREKICGSRIFRFWYVVLIELKNFRVSQFGKCKCISYGFCGSYSYQLGTKSKRIILKIYGLKQTQYKQVIMHVKSESSLSIHITQKGKRCV